MDKLERVKKAALAMQRYSWEQGVLAQAFLESGEEEWAMLLALEGANRQTPDGRCAQIGYQDAATDPCAIGEALIFAWEKTGDAFLGQAKDDLLRWALQDAPRNAGGIVYHLCSAPEFWVDSMYMLPPFLARAGYVDEAMGQLQGYWDALWDEKTGLLAHRWDDGKKAFIRKEPWAVGNGWACAGMARVMGLLPKGYENQRRQLMEKVKIILDHALPHQMRDGMFHDVLDDETAFPEINAGQMFAYTIYRGVREGWLEERYLPFAEKIRERALQCVDEWGLVRPVCGMPNFDRPGIAVEGQAFFILMESARRRLAEANKHGF